LAAFTAAFSSSSATFACSALTIASFSALSAAAADSASDASVSLLNKHDVSQIAKKNVEIKIDSLGA